MIALRQMFRHITPRRTLHAAAVAVAVFFTPFGTAEADAGNLEGSWSGNGQVIFPSGDRENARCKASFRKNGGNSYGMSAVCATASAKIVQNAQIQEVANNRFRGEFQNPEYGISGSIRIVLNGSRLQAALDGGGGTAEFNLSK